MWTCSSPMTELAPPKRIHGKLNSARINLIGYTDKACSKALSTQKPSTCTSCAKDQLLEKLCLPTQRATDTLEVTSLPWEGPCLILDRNRSRKVTCL